MTFATFCSGIGAPEQAWTDLGWKPLWTSEIEPFPSAVLAERHPEATNLGNMEEIDPHEAIETYGRPDVVCAGTPCQSFSVAGLRGGMVDPRGNLALVYLRLVDAMRPAWVVWENVPGVLSSGQGRDFGSFVGALGQLGYGWAYRILDAQYFGIPQRRRRVFVVGYLGDWRRAAAVLFERTSMRRNTAPSRAKGKAVARSLRARANASHREDSDTYVCGTLNANGKAAGSATSQDAANWLLVECEAISVCMGSDPISATEIAQPQTNRHGDPGVVCRSGGVRRLTPTECERLQGFPDGYTLVDYRGKPASDGPRYKALGNSMAVPVLRWIGERIQAVDGLEENMQ